MNKVNMKKKGVREMAQGLRALVALVEDLDLIPRTCIRHLTTPSNSSPRKSNTLVFLPEKLYTQSAHAEKEVHTRMHIGKVFINEEKKGMERGKQPHWSNPTGLTWTVPSFSTLVAKGVLGVKLKFLSATGLVLRVSKDRN